MREERHTDLLIWARSGGGEGTTVTLLREEGVCTEGCYREGSCPLAAQNYEEHRVSITIREQWHGTEKE